MKWNMEMSVFSNGIVCSGQGMAHVIYSVLMEQIT